MQACRPSAGWGGRLSGVVGRVGWLTVSDGEQGQVVGRVRWSGMAGLVVRGAYGSWSKECSGVNIVQ